MKVNIADLFAGKKGIIFGVPGAFTPGCSKVFIVPYPVLVRELPVGGDLHVLHDVSRISLDGPLIPRVCSLHCSTQSDLLVLTKEKAQYTKCFCPLWLNCDKGPKWS